MVISLGSCCKDNASLELIACSIPAISGKKGVLPVAINIRSAE